MTAVDAYGAAPLLVLVAALLLDALLPAMAEASVSPNPRRLAGILGRWLTARLDRARRSEGTRLVRGALVTLVIAVLSGGLGWMIERVSRTLSYGILIELALVTMLIGQRSLFVAVRRILTALARGPGGLSASRKIVAGFLAPGWDAERLDAHGVARLAIEALSIGFSERVVAPAFWFALTGLPGLFIAAAVEAIAARGPVESAFATTATRLDDLLQYVPARLAALLLALGALCVPGGRPFAAFRAIGRDAQKHRTLNRGWPVAATAGALDLALGGPRLKSDGSGVPGPWIGAGRARADLADIRRALYLFTAACLANAAATAALAFARAAL
ncbi:MAG TPA: cobalamin biosynthesis protein [Alphaproteobacteria bacterium]|nr:cobalamin biosynthesis protein [Alphaproteobacteria bacterium]